MLIDVSFRKRRTPIARSALREVLALVWSRSSRFVKVRFGLALLLVLVSAVLAPLGPLALKLLVDKLTGHPVAMSIAALGIFYVASQWLSRIIGEVRGLVYSRAERRMFRTLSERLFGHVMRLPLRFHLERQTGAITQTLENGLQGYHRIVNQLVFTFLPVSVRLATIALILLQFGQLEYLAIFCTAAVCYGFAYAHLTRRVSGLARAASSARVEATGMMTDSIINYETVKLFAAEETVQHKVSRGLLDIEERWHSFHRFSATNGIIVASIQAAFLGISVVFSLHQVGAAEMTVGDFVLVNTYMLQVMQPVEQLGRAVQGLAEGTAMLDRMLALFREKPELAGAAREQPLPGRGSLRFENVGVAYRSDRPILRDVSFDLPAGRTLGIVGASGAGKSTVVRLLVRLIEADCGQIVLDGVPLPEMSLHELRSAIAVVPQDTVLFNDSIGYNIGFGKSGSTQEEIERSAKLAHLHDFVMGLPEGYETRVGERGVRLSGGEKQRVSIARAALKQPRLYVFDEATSSLDTRTEREILQNLQEISRRCTTLIVAHRLSTVVHADEIVVLEEGTIVERGSHADLLRLDGRYRRLWDAQQAKSEPAPMSA